MEKIKIVKNLLILVLAFGVTVSLMGILKGKINNQAPVLEEVARSEEYPIEQFFTSIKGVKIFVDTPKDGNVISSPLTIKGMAPGSWFFEASAPVVVTNWDGLIIGESYITAKGDWMTTDYVPFEGTIEFTNTEYGDYGFLILKKDNPSGEPQFDDAVEYKIMFK
jgi:hypothetical protein